MAKRKAAVALGCAEALLDANDYAGCAAAAKKALGDLDLSMLSRAATLRGIALMIPMQQRLPASVVRKYWGGKRRDEDDDEEPTEEDDGEEPDDDEPTDHEFRECWELFKQALALDPENDDAKREFEALNAFLISEYQSFFTTSAAQPEARNHAEPLDVVVIGAGASGVGVALMLTQNFGLDPERILLVERGEGVGETFRRWPREMRFISPSFNYQGWTNSFDLNSVAYGTSPAFTLHAEHPTGEQYARYLSALAEENGLRVRVRTEVTAVRPKRRVGFQVDIVPAGPSGTAQAETLRSRYVVWAAGEFQYPRVTSETELFPGSELCLHNSSVRSWAKLPGDDFVVIGGYESGMDAAVNLALNGKRCTVVSPTAFWKVTTDDPSTELAPYTAERLRAACATSVPPKLLASLRVSSVEKGKGNGSGYLVRARWGPRPPQTPDSMGKHREQLPATAAPATACKEGTELTLRTPQPPVLCAGFRGSIALGVSKDLFEWGLGSGGGDEVSPRLSLQDESTKTPGLFLVGPAVRHGELSFCFIYKFRQRFGIVADAIAQGLGHDTTDAVAECRKMNMFLDDFSCCQAACGEACKTTSSQGLGTSKP